MARRTRSTETENTPAETTVEATTTEENTVSAETIEAVEPVETPAEDVATEATDEATVEVEFDLTEFQLRLDEAFASRDETTGEVPTAAVDPVVKAYRAVSGTKGKNAAKKVVTDAMKTAMSDADLPGARAFLSISEQLVAGPATPKAKAEKAPVDPTEAFVELVTGLRLAAAVAYAHAPEGVNEDWASQVEAKLAEETPVAESFYAWFIDEAEDKVEEPEVPAHVSAAVKLALGKSAKVGTARKAAGSSPFTGERRNVAKHIEEAFAGLESGTFLSIADIRKFKSAEYGSDAPSPGAISARLFPTSGKVTVEGVVPDTQGGIKGAVKA